MKSRLNATMILLAALAWTGAAAGAALPPRCDPMLLDSQLESGPEADQDR